MDCILINILLEHWCYILYHMEYMSLNANIHSLALLQQFENFIIVQKFAQ